MLKSLNPKDFSNSNGSILVGLVFDLFSVESEMVTFTRYRLWTPKPRGYQRRGALIVNLKSGFSSKFSLKSCIKSTTGMS